MLATPIFRSSKARPDITRFVDTLMGRRTVDRAPLVEYIVDEVVMRPVLKEFFGRDWVLARTRTCGTGSVPGQLHRVLARDGV